MDSKLHRGAFFDEALPVDDFLEEAAFEDSPVDVAAADLAELLEKVLC